MNRVARSLFGACLLFGCKSNPAPGELVVLLSSDMQVPNSFDTVILQVGSVQRVYRNDPLGNPIIDEADCHYQAKPHERPLELPATVSIISDQQNATTLNGIRLIACKEGRVVFSERFDAELPEPGQVQMIRAPIRWLCTNREYDCYGCGASPCHHRNVGAADPSQCVPDACRDHSVGVYEDVDFEAPEVALHVSGRATGTCFDPGQCFAVDSTNLMDSQVAVGWESDPDNVIGNDKPRCLGTLLPGPERRDHVNLALVVPSDSGGYCNDARCLVPLDADTPVGWSWLLKDPNSVELPRAVCHMLDSGQILYVARSENCSSKSFRVPICAASSEQPPAVPDTDDNQLFVDQQPDVYYPFDDLSNDASQPIMDQGERKFHLQLQTDSEARLQMVSYAGLRGTNAGRFNSHQYARSGEDVELKGDFSVSAWISPEEYSDNDEPTMPILSNLSSDCQSGVRLELRLCEKSTAQVLSEAADGPHALLAAVGRPVGIDGQGRCKLEFKYAPLSRRSFAGGYFTPWHSGKWYHLLATLENGVAKLYVDGTRADQSQLGDCQSVIGDTRDVQASDASKLYVGWHADGLAEAGLPAASPSRSILIDEVMLFQQALSELEIIRLELVGKSEPGESGLRWGTWGEQGGYVTRTREATGLVYTLHDEGFSSAGVFAVLGQPKDILNVNGSAKLPDLSDFDEAVLVTTGWSSSLPFQFALSSDHGLRQCTWQLQGNEQISAPRVSKSSKGQRDSFVINLRRPSWCVTPDLVLDTKRIDRVSIGSDWKDPQPSYDFEINALAFRKRHFASSTNEPPPVLGGVIGPNGWYWKAVAYDPRWEPQPVKQMAKIDGATPVEMPKGMSGGSDEPELAADLPDNQGSRDFGNCKTMEICVNATDSAPPHREPMFVMQNEREQTWSVSLPPTGGCPVVAELDGGYPWPADSGRKPTLDDVRSAVTRVSIRYSGTVQVLKSVRCCDTSGDCHDI